LTSIADRVFLARHGRTALNAEGRLRGLSDPPLDEVGIAEVARLAEALARKHPTAVICSPLQRAVATAQAIGSASGAPVTVDARLNDRDYGPMTTASGICRKYARCVASRVNPPLASRSGDEARL